MERKEIVSRLVDIFIDVLEDDDLELTEELSHDTCEEWDSLAQITLLVSIENEFSIKFDAKEMERMNSVKSIVDSIQDKIG